MAPRNVTSPSVQEVIDHARQYMEQAHGWMAMMAPHRSEPELLALHRTAVKIKELSDNLEKLVEQERKKVL